MKWYDFYGREVPMELVREARGSEVHLNMEDHRHEEYVPLKPKVKAFSGKGHVLGRYDNS
jgi:UBX domain-containing protein 1